MNYDCELDIFLQRENVLPLNLYLEDSLRHSSNSIAMVNPKIIKKKPLQSFNLQIISI